NQQFRGDLSAAYSQWGSQFLSEQDPKTAREMFDRALQTTPADPAALNGKALACLQLGAKEEAVRLLEQALALVPNNREIRLNLQRAISELRGAKTPDSAK